MHVIKMHCKITGDSSICINKRRIISSLVSLFLCHERKSLYFNKISIDEYYTFNTLICFYFFGENFKTYEKINIDIQYLHNIY